MTENYLTVLEDSLRKKLQVMEEIHKYNLLQQEIFQSDDVDMSKFDEYVAEKGALVEKVSALDIGFERLYARVAEELKNNRGQYTEQIRTLQQLVKEVTDASVAIQAQEARNKKLVEDFFKRAREGVRSGRQTSRAAYDYYKNMSKSSVVLPQYMDSKQ